MSKLIDFWLCLFCVWVFLGCATRIEFCFIYSVFIFYILHRMFFSWCLMVVTYGCISFVIECCIVLFYFVVMCFDLFCDCVLGGAKISWEFMHGLHIPFVFDRAYRASIDRQPPSGTAPEHLLAGACYCRQRRPRYACIATAHWWNRVHLLPEC